jgi:serine phosphatase RsbU (regulator of sigma subunit)
MPSVHILRGANAGQRLQLDKERIVLGRNPDCHIVINGTAVSRAHAHIICVDGQYFIEDLHSRNKTFVNNQEIAPDTRVLLKDHDRIKICDFLCTFHEGAVLKPLPADLRPEEPEPPDDSGGSTTVEASLSNVGSHVLLETQPAEKLNALLEITGFLSRTLEVDPLLSRIVDSLFQLFKQADRVFLILRDEGTPQRLLPKIIRTRRPNDETMARFSRRIVNLCLENVQALLSDDASGDSRFALSQSIADFRIRSVMCAPLWSQDGRAFGVIQLDTQDRNKKFTQDDLALLLGVANQASIALENAKLHEDLLYRERLRRDLELAREVQRGFLPLTPPEVANYEFFAFYESAQEIGGDYYDFVTMPQKRLGIILGDVAGKGVPAALLMAKVSADARTTMLLEQDAARAITRLNTLLMQSGLTDRFVTLVAMVLDPALHSVSIVNAGHPSPLVYRSGGELEDAVATEVAGLPVGVLDNQIYGSCSVQLAPGDCIIAFSDGVTDAMNTENVQLQLQGIRDAIQGGPFSARSLGERIVERVKKHALGRSQHDDITVVCFGRVS